MSYQTHPALKDPLYAAIRKIAFSKEPEAAHDWAFNWFSKPWVSSLLSKRYAAAGNPSATTVAGLSFPNRIGLAAGLDKNGDYINALGALGFGFIEVGTVTPKPQAGNDKPRMFRLTEHGALINRMGFNNLGVDHLVKNAEQRQWQGVLGINIGKNAATPLENAHDDYVNCLERVYPVADYVTVNISSPNTKDLRQLQHGDALAALLDAVMTTHTKLATQHGANKPLFVKIAPDMSDDDITQFIQVANQYPISGVIVSNTTARRDLVEGHPLAMEAGGLSGEVMRDFANERLQSVQSKAPNNWALIGAGGVSSGDDAKTKLTLGADLVQIYTGFIYHGPRLIQRSIEQTR